MPAAIKSARHINGICLSQFSQIASRALQQRFKPAVVTVDIIEKSQLRRISEANVTRAVGTPCCLKQVRYKDIAAASTWINLTAVQLGRKPHRSRR